MIADSTDEAATNLRLTIEPGDTLTFNGSVLTVLAGMATIRLETPGTIARGKEPSVYSKGIRKPRRLRRSS